MHGCVEPAKVANEERAWPLDDASDPVLVVSSTGTILATNRKVETILGYDGGELIGSAFDAVVISAKPIELRLGGVCFVGGDRGLQIRYRSGQLMPAELVICPDKGVLIVVVRLAPAIVREEDLAEIVHDLKSPLTTIALEAHLLGARTVQLDQIDRIERNVAYMDRLVHELLDLCSIDTGHFVVQRRPTQLRDLIERVIERALPSVQRDRVFVDAPTGVVVACDDVRIERVIANFIENALKYAPGGNAIIVRLSVSSTHACVSVIDSGPGIPAEELGSLFDKYRRGSTARGHSGSGIGLYISRKIVEAHGGSVGVDSVPGVGSRFFFELPVSPRAGAAVETAQRGAANCGGDSGTSSGRTRRQ
jgi:signal transduction histidine kinase